MAGRGVEVVVAGGLLVVVGFGVGALGTVAGRVGDFDKAPAVEHKARPPAVGDEPPRPVDLAEKEGCYKSRFTLLGGKKATCRGSGPDWRAGAGARVWSPLPPGLSKESGER